MFNFIGMQKKQNNTSNLFLNNNSGLSHVNENIGWKDNQHSTMVFHDSLSSVLNSNVKLIQEIKIIKDWELLVGGNLKIEGFINPCLPVPTSLPSNCSSWPSIIFHFLSLWLLAQHEISCPLWSNCLPWTQCCNRNSKHQNYK